MAEEEAGFGTAGEAASAEAVKSHIKSLIDHEDPKKILSDDKLVALLNKSSPIEASFSPDKRSVEA